MGARASGTFTGYNYFGSYALAICFGPVRVLYTVKNGDTTIWTGPILSNSADANGMTLLSTTIGPIRFYWGSMTQNIDTILASLKINYGTGPVTVPVSALRGVCYAVCDSIAFGQQPVPPVLNFHVQRQTSGLSITHGIFGNCVVPEAIYETMKNTLFGCGLAGTDLDTTSFTDASNTTVAELTGASPNIDSVESARDLISAMLKHIDAFIYFDGGKFVIKLIRSEDTSGLVVINESDLLDEPRPVATLMNETWNRTIVVYHDINNKWEEVAKDYVNPANFELRGRKITKTFNFPWMIYSDDAARMAKHLGLKGGVPANSWEVSLKPSRRSLKLGQQIKLSYGKFGITNRVMRIKNISRGGPANHEVKCTLLEEYQRDIANDYQAPLVSPPPNPTVDETGGDPFGLVSTIPRLSWLPAELMANYPDGLLIAAEQPTRQSSSIRAWFSVDPAHFNFRSLASIRSFPAHGVLLGWHQIRTTRWMLRVQFDKPWDYEYVQWLSANTATFYAVTGMRLIKTVGYTKNEHQVMASWLVNQTGGVLTLISPTVLEIEMVGGAFGTDNLQLETGSVEGKYPTQHIYFGVRENFLIIPNTINFMRNAGNAIGDTDLKRYIKTTVGVKDKSELIAAVAATTYDRDDTTMCPDGTLSRDWGAYVPSTYQAYNTSDDLARQGTLDPALESILESDDIALGHIYEQTGTVDELLMEESVDAVLGSMVSDPHQYYNV